MKENVITPCRLWLICLLAGVSVHVRGIELADADWAALCELYTATDGANWTNKWTLGATAADTETLWGVTISDGHVTSISLSGNNLRGQLPASLFKLPALWSIYLSDNQLTGDLTAIFNNDDMPENSVITSLELKSNQLTGNMYYLMSKLTALDNLDLRNNRIRDCYPLPERYISTANWKGQDLTEYMVDEEGHPYKLSTLFAMASSGKENTELLPTILLLDYSSNRYIYKEEFSMNLCDVWNYKWRARLMWRRSNQKSAFVCGYGYNFDSWGAHSYYSEDAYRGELNAQVWVFAGWFDPNSTNYIANFHRFPFILDTPYGDVNFDCRVTLSDMHNLLYAALHGYFSVGYITRNVTAANIINTDNEINVQDVVACINILLDQNITPTLPSREMYRQKAPQQTDEAKATLTVDSEGRLVLRSAVPLAALELQLTDGDVEWQEALRDFAHAQRGGHHIFYSLTGEELPAGTSVLASTAATLLAANAVDRDGIDIQLSTHQGVTGVNAVADYHRDGGKYYDLQGRTVAKGQLRSGIYVKDGKKYIVK